MYDIFALDYFHKLATTKTLSLAKHRHHVILTVLLEAGANQGRDPHPFIHNQVRLQYFQNSAISFLNRTQPRQNIIPTLLHLSVLLPPLLLRHPSALRSPHETVYLRRRSLQGRSPDPLECCLRMTSAMLHLWTCLKRTPLKHHLFTKHSFGLVKMFQINSPE